jgi:hypothetical protein
MASQQGIEAAAAVAEVGNVLAATEVPVLPATQLKTRRASQALKEVGLCVPSGIARSCEQRCMVSSNPLLHAFDMYS